MTLKQQVEEHARKCREAQKRGEARPVWAGANLAYANLAYANLARANLAGANLARANLARANLTGANLTGASLAGASLAGTGVMRLYDGDYEATLYPGGEGGPELAYGCARHPLKVWADAGKRREIVKRHKQGAERRKWCKRIAAIVALAKLIPQPERAK